MDQELRKLQYRIQNGREKTRVFTSTDFNLFAWQVQHLAARVRTVPEQMLCRRLHTLAVQKSDERLAAELSARDNGLKPGYYLTKNNHVIRINRLVPVGEHIECYVTDLALIRVTYDSSGKVVGEHDDMHDLVLDSREDLELFSPVSLLDPGLLHQS